jgi:EpsI family protein
MRRRDLVLGALGVSALAVSEALKPRKRLILLKGEKISEALPATFGAWDSQTASGLVTPEQAGRLARTLYSEIVQRTYLDKASGAEVMLLVAYGDTQSDLLQLHRPESCYPAVGFKIELTQPFDVPLGGKVFLPARRVIATTDDRRENIVYWSRMGERLPRNGEEQRADRLANAMQGYVPDGILVRCSVLGNSDDSFAVLQRFVPELLRATRGGVRPALIGTKLSDQLATMRQA